MKIARCALALVLLLATPAPAFTTRDMLGREVRLAAPPARIVSLVPSVTEILYALNAEDMLVGVTDFCDFPPEARRKPSVGGMVAPSLEAVAALRPDLVIATTEGTREDTFTQLTRLGIPVYLVAVHRVAEVKALIVRLGGLTGRQAEAALLDSGVVTNRNSIPADPNGAWYTSGIRFGTPALTTRGFGHDEFDRVAELVVDVLRNTEPGTTKAGGPSKATYVLADGVADRTHAAAQEMLDANPLYPGLEL